MVLEEVIQAVVRKNLINDSQPSLDLFSLDYFRERVASLKEAFPEDYINHAMAVKANCLRGIMKEACGLGLGAECASLQEAKHALAIGFSPSKVVFDSPVKTSTDLKEAVHLQLHTNLDNENEINRLSEYILQKGKEIAPLPVIGLRINPVVGAGQIDMMSTASKQSKFGLPLMKETKGRLINLFKNNSWLTGVHIHVGSQGVEVDKFVSGCRVLMDFVGELEEAVPGQVKVVDIGGGLSTSYTENEEPKLFTYKRYRHLLSEQVPELFSGKYQLVTEFGRSLFLKAGTSLTRVEHIKDWVEGQRPILLTHLGTNQFPRTVYLPNIWKHRFMLLDSAGMAKQGPMISADIGGPLCFQGDYLAKEIELPPAVSGDILAIRDTGAYTMSMYCKFNSILASPVYGYWKEGEDLKFICFKERETVEECLRFWGLDTPLIV